jgi:tRNA(Ile)-lysidine synthase
MVPEPALLERFANDLDALIAADARIGVAVSGGPDSLALLMLAAAARPNNVEAATVDHQLRPGSREEAKMVGLTCERLGVSHRLLTAEWASKPETAIQQRARDERYRLLGAWAAERGLAAVTTAHHLDDQAETLVMRLARGAGVRGLAGMHPVSVMHGSYLPLLRPLLGWRRAELDKMCESAGLTPAADPGNHDERFERVRVRRALAEADWLDPQSLASSAANLRDADAALVWATEHEWTHAVTNGGAEIVYRPTDAPHEIRRRIVAKAVSRLATEGDGAELRGREIDRLLTALSGGRQATIRGVRCSGGTEWHFSKAPPRQRVRPNIMGSETEITNAS